MKFVYLLLLVLTVAVPLAKSFDEKIQMRAKWRFIFPALFYTAVLFIIWDVWFAKIAVWSFSSKYTLGLDLLGLPIEEWMFFFIVPYACFFVLEVLNYLFIPSSQYKKIIIFNYVLAAALLVFAVLNFRLLYTFSAALLASLVLLVVTRLNAVRPKIKRFYFAYLVCLFPFLLVNGVLTSLPVVSYNSTHNVGIRIFSIPIEDTLYLFSMLFINFSIYECLRKPAYKSVDY